MDYKYCDPKQTGYDINRKEFLYLTIERILKGIYSS